MSTEIKLCECGCGLPAPIATRNNTCNGAVKGQPQRFIRGHHRNRTNRGNYRPGRIIHGMTGTPEHNAYISARQRCTNVWNPEWEDYGGRGIKFLFESFMQFYKELGPRPAGMSLDRINNDGNYEPGNVRWATDIEQRHNQRSHRRAA